MAKYTLKFQILRRNCVIQGKVMAEWCGGVNGIHFLKIFMAISHIAERGRLLFLSGARCSHFSLRVSGTVFALLLFTPWAPGLASVSNITLHSDTDTATAGYFQLSWQAEQSGIEFILQESAREDFADSRVLYRGADLASVISGKPDYVYYYRVIESGNPANHSNTVKVTVAHHPLRNAFGFFSIGAIVFIATLILILRGARQGR